MSVFETVLVFVGAPALVILIVGGLAYLGHRTPGAAARYKPGRPYGQGPVWFLSTAEAETPRALPAAPAQPVSATGGASDRW